MCWCRFVFIPLLIPAHYLLLLSVCIRTFVFIGFFLGKVRYKAGLSATGVSFCSDGSVLAVAYSPTSQHAEDSHATGPKTANHGNHGQGESILPTQYFLFLRVKRDYTMPRYNPNPRMIALLKGQEK